MTTISEVTHQYVRDRLSTRKYASKTVRIWWQHLERFERIVGELVLDVTPESLRRWGKSLDLLAPTNAKNHALTIRCLLTYGHELGAWGPYAKLVPHIPVPRSVPRALSVDALARLYGVLPDERARVIVALMAECGLRCAEVSRLNCTDLCRPHGKTLTARVVGKGQHERIVPIPVQVEAIMSTYLGARRLGPVVHSKHGRLHPATISTFVKEWMTTAGIKECAYDGVSAHALRHTAASRVFDQSHDLSMVMRLLGHANLSTSSRYLRIACLDDLTLAMTREIAFSREVA